MADQPGPADPGVEKHNNLLAAGALLVILGACELPTLQAVSPITDEDGNVTNEIAVQFTFLQSTYCVTIERVPDRWG